MGASESQPMVSVVVPVRNGAATIGSLLESFMRLEYDRSRLEIVVVDGHSTDATRDIVARYPVKLITQQGKGLNGGRNSGVRNSSGEIIAFTDADCVVPKNWVTQIVHNFEDPKVGCVGGNSEGLQNNFLSRYADNSVFPAQRVFNRRHNLDMIGLFSKCPAGSNMAFRRGVIEEVGGFDEDLSYGFDEDELVERVCRAGFKMVLDPEVSVKHKHRSTLRTLMEQNVNFGRGGGILVRKKKARDTLSMWCLLSLIIFLVWLTSLGALAVLTLATKILIFPLALLMLILAPLLASAAFYTFRALQNGRYGRIIVYPPLDFLRAFTFCIGEIHGLLTTVKKGQAV